MSLMSNYAREDITFVKGDGAKILDSKGKNYIDFGSGIGVCSLGHANKKIAKTISEQSRSLLHTSNIYTIKSQITLSKSIDKLLGYKTYAFFCNSGAEANECAIKLARKYGTINFKEKKFEILTLKNSFHGRTMATLAATGQDKFHPEIFAPYTPGFKFFDTIDEIIKNIDDKTVAVMIELVQGEGGIKPLPKDDIVKLSKVLKKRNLLLITDEVQCGVFRTGEFVTSQIYGIKPDIITFAKGLGGGVPIGACVSTKDIFTPGDHGSTFGGNFLVTSVANTVLSEILKLKESGKLNKNIKTFNRYLDKMVERYSEIFESKTGLGLMLGLKVKDAKYQDLVYRKCLEKGVLVLKSGKDIVRFLPPLNIKKDEIKDGFKRFKDALNEI
ncbi:acetylornithine/succinylornithine family transaminase [Campylobacter corcagiensis]|uniref:Acetylornithine/succinylornithine family transaminase n=1 Tax=Campylobacter corcagiensis TaxID=1448857 RepID=A0A7M1LEZ4_9BACT|nr:acetylornithine/succinylornithine family transaminase [Campylobacter corcagiensis]QKF64828.1 N-succinyldiaminopimelate-aminotransferase / acetylornithine transaminase [Campylobacter corcagiensis]QOQ87010.1 acetylornithine/succinylornithine family transaminase [Campylobacter corcagiensis]